MWRLAGATLDLVYPRRCGHCGRRLDESDGACLCPACSASVESFGTDQCARCGAAIGPYAGGPGACRVCSTTPALIFHFGTAALRYRGPVRQLVHNLKFHGDLSPSPWMSEQLLSKVRSMPWCDDLDIVVPVPLHWTRRLARRFNQSEVLARPVARGLGRPLVARTLRRIRKTDPQSVLEPPQRRENVRGAFRVVRPNEVRGRNVLLVDDVMSTCATASECARALKQAGAKRICVAVFAR